MNQTENSSGSGIVLFLSSLMLIIVSLHGVLNHAQVLLVLETLAVLTVFMALWGGISGKVAKSVLLFIGFTLALAIVYAIPLPPGFLAELTIPGREIYTEVHNWLDAVGVESQASYLSIIPYKSTLALLSLLPPLAMFLAGISLSNSQVKKLVYILLIITVIQAVLGLIQYASGNPDYYFGLVHGSSAQGTYVNRDHFGALMEMTLPIAIGGMLFAIGRDQYSRDERITGRVFNRVMLFFFVAILILLAAIFSKSRAAVALIMFAVLLTTLVFARHVGGKKSASLSVIFATISVGLASVVGLIPVFNRFVSNNPIEDERWRILENSIVGIKQFFPIGSGPGTFQDVYRVFQPAEQLYYINNVHNDYVELVFELGAVGLFIIIGFLVLYIANWVRLRRVYIWDEIGFIQAAAGIGILLILLHCTVDFILHEPMNMMIFGLLCGVFFGIKKRAS